MRGDRRSLPERLISKAVQPRRTRTITSKVKNEQAMQPGIVADVVGREIEVMRNGDSPCLRPGPILAQQCALMVQLTGVTVRESHAVACGKQKCGSLVTPDEIS